MPIPNKNLDHGMDKIPKCWGYPMAMICTNGQASLRQMQQMEKMGSPKRTAYRSFQPNFGRS